jgi:hypothetical protein
MVRMRSAGISLSPITLCEKEASRKRQYRFSSSFTQDKRHVAVRRHSTVLASERACC